MTLFNYILNFYQFFITQAQFPMALNIFNKSPQEPFSWTKVIKKSGIISGILIAFFILLVILGNTFKLTGIVLFSQFIKNDFRGGMEKTVLASLPQFMLPLITKSAVIGSPSTDLAIVLGTSETEIVAPRAGNDVLLAVDPSSAQFGRGEIDFLMGDSGKDIFVLGDWRNVYYNGGGNSNLASILDFNLNEDKIQLNGKPSDYYLVNFSQINLPGQGTAIFKNGKEPDIIALLLDASNLNLNEDYFKFVGNTPDSKVVLPDIKQLGTIGADYAFAITNDHNGNIYLTGGTTGSLEGTNAGGEDAWVTKYDSNGNVRWIRQFGTSVEDKSLDIATDPIGNIYLIGYTFGSLGKKNAGIERDVWVAKFDTDGNKQWIKQFGTFTLDKGWGIDVDDNSNIYVTGYTLGSLAALNQGYTDTWIAKFDTSGDKQWMKQFGTTNFEDSFGVAVDKYGNVYAAGDIFKNGNASTYDAKIIKYDNAGNQQWIKRFGTTNVDWLWDIATDSNGDVYATGYTLGNSEGSNAGSYDNWVMKFDGSGSQQWIRQFGSSGEDLARGIAIDEFNNLYLTGSTDGNLGGANAGSFDAWVAKYDNKGNQLWIKQFGTADYENSHSITVDSAGHVYVTGLTEGSLGGTNTGSYDIWIAKLSSTDGNLLSLNSCGETGSASSKCE
ncbi:hemolysin-type calcium-binding region [Cylindrospermum sp. NIES-4074]|nr:hemolysin-type calcium-binding region [Cylindrospermum sp. NIES-4074]